MGFLHADACVPTRLPTAIMLSHARKGASQAPHLQHISECAERLPYDYTLEELQLDLSSHEESSATVRQVLPHRPHDYANMVTTALSDMANCLFKAYNGVTENVVTAAEAIFNVENASSWLPCMTKPVLTGLEPVDTVRTFVQHIWRLKFLSSLCEEAQKPVTHEFLSQDVMTDEIPAHQLFCYVYRFNRFASAKKLPHSRTMQYERILRTFLTTSNQQDKRKTFESQQLPPFNFLAVEPLLVGPDRPQSMHYKHLLSRGEGSPAET